MAYILAPKLSIAVGYIAFRIDVVKENCSLAVLLSSFRVFPPQQIDAPVSEHLCALLLVHFELKVSVGSFVDSVEQFKNSLSSISFVVFRVIESIKPARPNFGAAVWAHGRTP